MNNIGLLAVLCPKELKEIYRLSVAEQRRYFQAGYADFTNQQLVLFRGDGTHVIAPFDMFEPTPMTAPDFQALDIIDYGLTVKLGYYEASTRSILIDLDPEYKEYCQSIQYNEYIPGEKY